jgi:glycerophosphoryl diester phosphodiesterase
MKPNGWLSTPRTLIIGHRGASTTMPENSLGAFNLAIEQGADGVETDVRLSKDGRPVLFHDATLQRLNGNPSKICDLTVDELKQEDIGQGQTVALLDELFELLGNEILYNIELKDFGLRDQGLVDLVFEAVTAYGLESQVLISSFNPILVRRARGCFPLAVPIALIRGPGVYRHTGWTVDTGVENPHYSLVDRPYMTDVAASGRHIFTWTVDDVAEAERLVELGVHGIISNEPAYLLEHLAF